MKAPDGRETVLGLCLPLPLQVAADLVGPLGELLTEQGWTGLTLDSEQRFTGWPPGKAPPPSLCLPKRAPQFIGERVTCTECDGDFVALDVAGAGMKWVSSR